MVRFSFLFGGLLCTAISAVLVRGTAIPDLSDAQKRKTYVPYVAAATDCLARAILETPVALQRAREGAWIEAVKLTGHHCDPVVGRMIFAYDQLYGSETGRDLSREAYVANLPSALATRLQADLDHNAAGIADQHARKQVARVVAPSP
jgi:hypothetical protein